MIDVMFHTYSRFSWRFKTCYRLFEIKLKAISLPELRLAKSKTFQLTANSVQVADSFQNFQDGKATHYMMMFQPLRAPRGPQPLFAPQPFQHVRGLIGNLVEPTGSDPRLIADVAV
jgi:hypothetical protein